LTRSAPQNVGTHLCLPRHSCQHRYQCDIIQISNTDSEWCPMLKERVVRPAPGLAMIVVFLLVIGVGIWLVARAAETQSPVRIVRGVLLFLIGAIGLGGIFVVNPNEAKVLTLFGRYVGSAKDPGLWFVNPFTAKRKISLRVRNFETAKLKVNDSHGNPIDIAT